MKEYNEVHAKSGLNAKLPVLETFPNQFQGYTIRIEIPEYTAVCPKTGLPDFGTILLEYQPVKHVLELKSLKGYVLAYRNVGIFYENAVNRMLKDFVAAARPKWCRVTGEFNTRGGMHSTITAQYGVSSKKP
jgi:7-cyano-7-deazaguanine reductase